MSYVLQKPSPIVATAPEELAIPHSSFLQAATYDAVNYSLTLDFKAGDQIVHRYVFPTVWQQFKEAKSHGSFYATQIKGKYPSMNFKSPLKVSDLEKAIKQHRPGRKRASSRQHESF